MGGLGDFLALEKQPSWQCVGGESPAPGLPACLGPQSGLAVQQVIEFNRMWLGLYTEVYT